MKNLGDYCGFDSCNTWNASAIARLVFCNNTVIYIGFDTQKEERKCISGGFVGGIKEANLIAIFLKRFSCQWVWWTNSRSVDCWSEHVFASFICNMMSSSSHTSCAEFKTSEADFVLGGEENLSWGDSICMYGQILFFKGHLLHSDNLLPQTFFFVHGESPQFVFQFILVCQYEQHRCSFLSNP